MCIKSIAVSCLHLLVDVNAYVCGVYLYIYTVLLHCCYNTSKRSLTMFMGVVALCYQHHTIAECHNFHKHNQSSLTTIINISMLFAGIMLLLCAFFYFLKSFTNSRLYLVGEISRQRSTENSYGRYVGSFIL